MARRGGRHPPNAPGVRNMPSFLFLQLQSDDVWLGCDINIYTRPGLWWWETHDLVPPIIIPQLDVWNYTRAL